MTVRQRLLRLLRGWLTDFFGEDVSPEVKLRSESERMLRELKLFSEGVSFAVALAESKREKLEEELANYEALGRQAEAFLKEGNESLARRCVVHQLRSQKKAGLLRKKYEYLQDRAEQRIRNFQVREREVKERISQLPDLQKEAQSLEVEDRVSEIAPALGLEAAQDAFDEVADELRIRKLQRQNLQLITSEPAEVEQKILASFDQMEVDAAMEALRQRVGESEDPEN